MTEARELDRIFLRGILAAYGMPLDQPSERAERRAEARADAPVDRAEVRATLESAGAPARDLEWLVASCPTVEDARGYRPPPVFAWCVDCCGPQPTDADGCQTCRANLTTTK